MESNKLYKYESDFDFDDLAEEIISEVSETNVEAAEDNDGHDWLCLAVWHCFTAVLHTEGGTDYEACWSDYKCGFVNK